MERNSALSTAAAAAWRDFLSNKPSLAAQRAVGWLHALPAALQSADDADALVALADLAHMAGAARDDAGILAQALAAYDAHLVLEPDNLGALRMRAETQLRLRDYAGAFGTFGRLHAASLRLQPYESLEVAPFRLVHDAECTETMVAAIADVGGRRSATDKVGDRARLAVLAAARARDWRQLAAELGGGGGAAHLRRLRVGELSAAQRALLGEEYGRPLLPPPPPFAPITALRARDWAAVEAEYSSKRVVVIDGLLDAPALAEMQRYARHGAHFRTMRAGYLGAFPADGTTHPLLLALVHELAAAAPSVFGAHALALWWLFKYDSTANPEGIGIHADPAAVNVNIWLADDAACVDGGGLAIYSHVPPLEQETQSVNREFESAAEEAALRERLKAEGDVVTVPYACNRAVVFVSDQYHESLPFRFAPGYANRRCNLTLLFGDRWSVTAAAAPAADAAGGDGWDVFF